MKANPMYSILECDAKRKKYRKRYYSVFITLASVVVFCTVYALILPAITMENKQKVLDCPLSVHQHTAECRDEKGALICGQADFVIHTHNESCYDAENELVCKLPEIAAHEHTDDCYQEHKLLICENKEDEHVHDESCYQTEKVLICKETAVLHQHDDSCYMENGTLNCGRLQVSEHVHGSACFYMEESSQLPNVMSESDLENNTQALLSEDGVVPLSDTAGNTSQTWGYNDDGSIWWSNITLNTVAISAIAENVPYIISGKNRANVLTAVTNGTKLKAVRPGSGNDSEYVKYAIWYFENAESGYRIRTGDMNYLKLSGETLSLTTADDASVFTLANAPDSLNASGCITAQTNGYYLNTYGGDGYGCSGFAGWNQPDDGSCLQIISTTGGKQTANRIDSVTSANTVINMFDYWVSSNRTDPDNTAALPDAGINKDHVFKFMYGDQDNCPYELNKWTGSKQLPLQGIVGNILDASGYPALSGNSSVSGTDSTESLEYLFNPDYTHDGKISYKNVNGLLTIDEQGYYAYNCKKNMAEFDEDNHSIRIYDKPGVNGQFFPFNKAPEIMNSSRGDSKINHYFGMTITTRFIQQHGGYTDDRRNTETTFHFSGDDDVWIFIDGVLVGDVGGIHDESVVNINFATGEVKVSTAGNSSTLDTTLRQCYEAAGKTDVTSWNDDKTTYRDGTTHTLKFFYLERGNYDSNMTLKYNLTEIPETAICKVDQYGESVPGATFAVYAADADYTLLDKKGGNAVSLPDSYTYDENGNIVNADKNIIANALYIGTTNQKGEMIFADSDGMPYSLSELQDIFGRNFILREIKVPDGYRVVSGNVHLEIWQGESQKILKCDNTIQSGSRAAATLQITATDVLHLRKPYNGSNTVEYCNANGESFGTLFAVVFKYIGDTDENGNALSNINDDKSWAPVYGSDKMGYTMMDTTGGLVKSALAAAVKSQEYGDTVFKLSSSGTMKLTMENLPGYITTYYRMLSAEQKGQARYTVGYYWTPEDNLEKATEENTYRVNTFAETSSDGIRYSGFERVFGANIQVPNLINKVIVQKVDENNTLINGATFAIYQVQQDEISKEIKYLADNGSYVTLQENAVVASNGVITSGDRTVNPLDTDVTKTYTDGLHTGTAEFSYLDEGQYIIKEIKPPPGYRVNTTDIMVLVTEDTIYANAGSENDGVTVGRGPGYLVSPLSELASEGQIDNTLSWIYARMLISPVSNDFKDATSSDVNWLYLAENNTGKGGQLKDAIKSYLMYAPDGVAKAATEVKAAFNYIPNEERNTAPNSTGTRRLFTTVGWNHYVILQDYEYGLEKVKSSGASYENWSKDANGNDLNLMHLFSRSTYIRVMDEQETTVTVKKVDSTNKAVGLADAQFRLYKTQTREDGTKEVLYYRWDSENETVQWTENAAEALIIATGENGMADTAFRGLKDGTYLLEEIRAPDGYYKPTDPVQMTITQAKLTVDSHDVTAEEKLDETTNLYTYTFVVPNRGGFELPATGGSGTIIYITGGVLMMTASLVCGYIRKRRSERRTE